jgi:hypothetical protein
MTIRNELIQNIETALSNTLSPTTSTNSRICDLYEAYIFGLIIEAAKIEGAQVTHRNIDGSTLTEFTFRTSPGNISSQRRPYSYAIIDFRDKPRLEVHLGVYVAGKSEVPHECDVAVIYSDEAETCRRNMNVLPRHTKVLISVECKFYTTGIGIDLGRGFLGLYEEIGFGYGSRYFVTNTSSRSVEKMLSSHKRQWGHEIVPSIPRNVDRLRSSFQTDFVHFKARK